MSSLTPLTTAALVTISAEGAAVATGKPLSIKPIIGGFILGVFLIGLYMINNEMGTYFSILAIVTALLINGIPILSKITGQKYGG